MVSERIYLEALQKHLPARIERLTKAIQLKNQVDAKILAGEYPSQETIEQLCKLIGEDHLFRSDEQKPHSDQSETLRHMVFKVLKSIKRFEVADIQIAKEASSGTPDEQTLATFITDLHGMNKQYVPYLLELEQSLKRQASYLNKNGQNIDKYTFELAKLRKETAKVSALGESSNRLLQSCKSWFSAHRESLASASSAVRMRRLEVACISAFSALGMAGLLSAIFGVGMVQVAMVSGNTALAAIPILGGAFAALGGLAGLIDRDSLEPQYRAALAELAYIGTE